MSSPIVQFFTDFYTTLQFEIHPILRDNILVNTPIPTIIVLLLYLLFVLKIGPNFMKNRPPYQLKTVIAIYNFIQVIYNLWIFFETYWVASHINWFCEPITLEDYPPSNTTITSFYYYFILKIIDLADTIFFVLRKKHNQVTFLHVYHHTLMVFFAWATLRYSPGGSVVYVTGFFNVPTHIIMYTYYLLAILGLDAEKWKKYVTQVQLFQHFCIFFIGSVTLFDLTCPYPRLFAFIMWFNSGLFIYLFSDFYIKNYLSKPTKKNTHQS